ncbi:hypothetical protein EVB87_045 [Rhizobium phage RHph_N28_1]|nr:hypothetical protein EVB87_045 [Rhizobium phage RHph_N28_1]QIG74073.1 hypothetical protein EVC07_045 [Rhizobium phage RHph_N42]
MRRKHIKIFGVEIAWDGAEWGPHGWYYIYWWNWLAPKYRYWGYEVMWHDGPHYSFGLWFTNVTWCLDWWMRVFGTEPTPYKGEDDEK